MCPHSIPAFLRKVHKPVIMPSTLRAIQTPPTEHLCHEMILTRNNFTINGDYYLHIHRPWEHNWDHHMLTFLGSDQTSTALGLAALYWWNLHAVDPWWNQLPDSCGLSRYTSPNHQVHSDILYQGSEFIGHYLEDRIEADLCTKSTDKQQYFWQVTTVLDTGTNSILIARPETWEELSKRRYIPEKSQGIEPAPTVRSYNATNPEYQFKKGRDLNEDRVPAETWEDKIPRVTQEDLFIQEKNQGIKTSTKKLWCHKTKVLIKEARNKYLQQDEKEEENSKNVLVVITHDPQQPPLRGITSGMFNHYILFLLNRMKKLSFYKPLYYCLKSLEGFWWGQS